MLRLIIIILFLYVIYRLIKSFFRQGREQIVRNKPSGVIDEMVQDMILKRHSAQEITRAAHQARLLKTLKEDAADKVAQGITTIDEAASAVMM